MPPGTRAAPRPTSGMCTPTLILGADAYGVTEITGGGLQHIVKQLGSAGTPTPEPARDRWLESDQGCRAPGGALGPH